MNHSKRGNRRLIRERALAITMAILFASMSVATALAMDLIPSERDTTNLYGGPATLDGKFETADGVPDKQGWVSQDMSPQGVGNFGQLWKDLGDADEDQDNQSPQWAFIDDGVVVEGVGPSYCTGGLFCYGPQGMVTNTTGGLVGGIATLHNEVLSEPIQLPQENGWPVLSLDIYLDNGRFPFQDWLFASYVLDATADPQGLTGWESYSDTFMHWCRVRPLHAHLDSLHPRVVACGHALGADPPGRLPGGDDPGRPRDAGSLFRQRAAAVGARCGSSSAFAGRIHRGNGGAQSVQPVRDDPLDGGRRQPRHGPGARPVRTPGGEPLRR